MFEGLQPNNSPNNNLYWTDNALSQWFHIANSAGVAPTLSVPLETAKANQISTTMKTDLLNNDKFIPLNVLGGCHLQLETEDYRRALEFTTGDLGVLNNSNNTNGTDGSTGSYGLCPGPINVNTDQDLTIVLAGTSVFTANNVYEAFAAGTPNPVGWVLVGAVTVGGAITAAKWFCTSNTAGGICYPNFNDAVGTNGQIDVKVGAGTVTTLSFGANGMNLGLLRVGSKDSPYYVDVAVANPTESGITGVAASHYGDGSVRQPFRVVNCQSKASAKLGQCQTPNDMNPFSIGDMLYINKADNTAQENLGLITGFSRSQTSTLTNGTSLMRVYFQPNNEPVSNLLNDATYASLGGGKVGSTGLAGRSYNFTAGYNIFVKQADRVNGTTTASYANITDPTYCSGLRTRAGSVINFRIENLEYHVKRVMMDERVAASDMALARGSGYKLDLESVTTSLFNLTNVLGPTSQMISIPNITRGLGVLSIPLTQNNQFELGDKSLVGNPTSAPLNTGLTQTGMTTYQYDLGSQIGRTPYRPVKVEKYSFKNPLIQTQAVAELIKANESFGYSTSSLVGLPMNFAIGRAFARTGNYFNLMESGNLSLLANFDNTSSGNKLFCHFIKHLRSVTVSSTGISIAN